MVESFSTTVVTYTPTWAFVEPWVPASSQGDAITFHLNTNAAASSIPVPFPTEIVSNGTAGGTLHFDTAPARDSSAVPTTVGSVIASEGTGSPLISTSSVPSSIDAHSSTESSSGTLTESASGPANGSTQTPSTPAATVYATILASKDHRGLSSGQTIGLAIGCIVVGAAIATLVACILVCRRRRAKISLSARSIRNTLTADNGLEKRSSPLDLKRVERPLSYVAIDTLLTRSTPDEDIVAIFTQVNTSIADHVQKCVDRDRVPLSTIEYSLNQRLGGLLGQNSSVGA
jgi:hypothetical protein